MRLQNPFAALSPSGIDAQVLFVLARSDRHLSVSQIEGLLPESGSRSGVQNSLARFVAQGTVVERVTGRNLAYAVNPEHLLAGVIREVAGTRSRLLERMREQIAAWPTPPVVAVVFGSAARDEMRDDSDVDVLFVLDDELQDAAAPWIGAFASQVAGWTGNDVRPLVYGASEVESAPVFDAIVREGLVVAGDPSWLRRRVRPMEQAR